MLKLRFFVLLLFLISACTTSPVEQVSIAKNKSIVHQPDSISSTSSNSRITNIKDKAIKGPLLSTWFKSFEELKSVIQIEYLSHKKPLVRLTHATYNQKVTSILKSGISEDDIKHAQDGSFWDRVSLGLNSPYLVLNKNNLLRVFTLGRRMSHIFGEGDVAFYDLAETMFNHIDEVDMLLMHSKDFSEKGYLNTFNHITAQAIMTSIFSEKLTDFIADAHERATMAELVTGRFSKDQITDLENGPVDNYVDMINNEWGQELGKKLKEKYKINRNTFWTPTLLAAYLNDIQSYYSWVFQIGFKPYRVTDQVVIRFSKKLNLVMGNINELK